MIAEQAGLERRVPPRSVKLNEMGHPEYFGYSKRTIVVCFRKRYPTLSIRPKGWGTRFCGWVRWRDGSCGAETEG